MNVLKLIDATGSSEYGKDDKGKPFERMGRKVRCLKNLRIQ